MQRDSTLGSRRPQRRDGFVSVFMAAASAFLPPTSLRADDAPLWSLRPFVGRPVPEVANRTWPQSRSDYFILARIEAAKLNPARDADPAVLLRRVHLDL